MGYSIRTEKWRYTEWDNGKRGTELYDENDDSSEMKNLATDAKYRNVASEMQQMLRKVTGK